MQPFFLRGRVAVPAGAATCAEQPAIHARLRRDQSDRIEHERHPHAGADRPRALLDRHRPRRTGIPAARQVAVAQGLTLSQNARAFALLNLAGADAFIAAWDAKFAYNQWRPVTAIRAADTDGNPATDADPSWTPLLVTPPFPDYIAGHTTYAGAAQKVLEHVFGKHPGAADHAHQRHRARRRRDLHDLQGDRRRRRGCARVGWHPLENVERARADRRRGDRALRRAPHAEADSRATVIAAGQEDSTRPFQTRTA